MVEGVCVQLLWLLLTALVASCITATPSTKNFYSFGLASGDQYLLRGVDVDSGFLNLSVPFPFYGKTRRFISVNNKGLVLFEDASSANYVYSLVFPFGARVDTTSAGQVFYRASTDATILNSTANQVKTAFLGLYPDFKPTLAFIATWFQVGYFNAHSIPNNTYQAVLLTNGTLSFSIFIYPLAGIQWTTADSDGGVNGFGGHAAIIGFVNDTGHADLLPGSGRSTSRLLTLTSNVNTTGVWVFRIDKTIAGPWLNECAIGYQYCDHNAYCIDRQQGFWCVCKNGFSGDGITCTQNEGSGSYLNQGSCIDAKHATCCYGNNCQAGDCYCDPTCYFLGDCCDDITTSCPYSAFDVLANFQMSEIRVHEQTTVSVCVQSWSVKVQQGVMVLVTTHSGTAIEGKDYAPKAYPLTLHGNSTMCVQNMVYGDQIIRDDRYFTIRLTTDSRLVSISTNTTVVWITDTSAANVDFTQTTYTVKRGQVVTVCAKLNGTCERQVGVTFSTMSGTALGGVDYVGQSMGVAFSVGVQPVACVEYQTLVGNGSASTSTYFTVTLTSADRAVLGTPQAVSVTIEQDSGTSPPPSAVGGAVRTIIIVASVGGVASLLIIVAAVVASILCGISQFKRTVSSNRKSLGSEKQLIATAKY